METLSQMQPTRLLMLAIAGFAIISVVVSRIQRWMRQRQFARAHGCLPPPRAKSKDPILGLDRVRVSLQARNEHRLLELNASRYREFGNTFKANIFGGTAIMTIDPENVKTVLALNFKDYGIGQRLKTFGPLLGAGIFDTDGDHWVASRAMIRPNFVRDQVADLDAFEQLIPSLLALIPSDGKTTVDLQDLFFRYTVDSATEFLFGHSVESLKHSQSSELDFAEAFNYAQQAVTQRMMLGPLAMFKSDPKAERCNSFCREFAQQFVDEAVRVAQEDKASGKSDDEKHEGKYVFSHELAKQTSDKRRILDECMNVLLAGRDTTASLLSNMFFMLAKRPELWKKLRSEVATLEGRLPTYGELRNLKFLKCCMNESLRLHPVVPMNGRFAIKDTVLPVGGGPDGKAPVFVPKGAQVGYNTYAMHRRPDFYGEDAEEFRPERWESGKLQPRWEYLPFNGGPRICVGQQYALTEVSYVTVRLLQEFETLESRDPGPWVESLTLTVCSHNGTKVCLGPAK